MDRFLYLQNPLNSDFDYSMPIINGLVPRKANIHEHSVISGIFSHYSKFNVEADYGDLFTVLPLAGTFDQNVCDALMLSDQEIYITLLGEFVIDKPILRTEMKIEGSFTHFTAGLKSPKRIRNTDLAENYTIMAQTKTMHSAILHEQFTIQPIGKIDTTNSKKKEVIVDPLTPQMFFDAINHFIKSGTNENISNAIVDYENLALIPYFSPLKILGYVSIIERLITDDSKNSYVSISSQFSRKIMLINNQLGKNKIDFSKWFNPSTSEEKILQKVYTLRSKIAHGSSSDFAQKELQELKNREHIQKFLNLLLKRIIYFALLQPKLVVDLKSC